MISECKIGINGYNANSNVSLSVTLRTAKITWVIKILNMFTNKNDEANKRWWGQQMALTYWLRMYSLALSWGEEEVIYQICFQATNIYILFSLSTFEMNRTKEGRQ